MTLTVVLEGQTMYRDHWFNSIEQDHTLKMRKNTNVPMRNELLSTMCCETED